MAESEEELKSLLYCEYNDKNFTKRLHFTAFYGLQNIWIHSISFDHRNSLRSRSSKCHLHTFNRSVSFKMFRSWSSDYSWPSVSTHSASMDSTNGRLKIFGRKIPESSKKAKLEFARALATIYIAFTFYLQLFT